jgi:hypothetical protein
MSDTKFTFVGSAFVALSSWTFSVINTKFHWGILQTNCLIFSLHSAGNCTGRGPIIANLHVTRERTRIFWPYFADENNKW